MQQKIVLFVSPELEETITTSLADHNQFECKVYSTGPDRKESLSDVERLTELLEGVDTCFIATSTDFRNHRNVEVQEGMSIGMACKRAGVSNIVLSSHLHCERTIGIPAKHYDAKADIYEYMRQTLGLSVTMVNIPPLYEMFFDFLCPTADVATEKFQLVFPSVGPAVIDFIALEDIGSCMLPIFKHPDVFRSKTVALSGDKINGKNITAVLNEELFPMPFVQKQVTVQEVRDRGFPGSIDLANMFEFLGRADLKASISATKELHPSIKCFRTWVRENKEYLSQTILRRNVSSPIDTAVVV